MKRENEHKEYCEQDILDQISRMSEDTEVPDSLRSENIDKLLEKKKQKKPKNLTAWDRVQIARNISVRIKSGL